MLAPVQEILFTYAALFPVLNPLSGSMMFLNFSRGLSQKGVSKLARQVSINTFILLTIVLLTGSWILSFFGITIPIVQIGGGGMLASFGWQLLRQPIKDQETQKDGYTDKDVVDLAFFPLTMPFTAGPGCIAITLTLGAQTHHKFLDALINQSLSVLGILLLSFTVWFCYRYSEYISRKCGENGSRVIMRLSAFINLCIGLQIVWDGVQGLLAQLAG